MNFLLKLTSENALRSCGWTVVVVALLVVGCSEETITVHRSVPVTRASAAANTMPGAVQNALPSGPPKFRMVTAIAQRPRMTWFFKMSGPIDGTKSVEPGWIAFLNSIEFESTEPTWTLPSGWSSDGFQNRSLGGGMKMRIAEIATSQKGVSVSVSSLRAGQPILANVNRWRGQLGLPPTDAEQLSTGIQKATFNEIEYTIFDAVGPTLASRMGGGGRPPFASGVTPPRGGPGNSKSPHSGLADSLPSVSGKVQDLPFEFQVPKGWESVKASSMLAGQWKKTDDETSTVIKLLAINPNDVSWRLNIETWAKRLEIDVPDIQRITQTILVDGNDARKVELFGNDLEHPLQNPAMTAVLFKVDPESGYLLTISGTQTSVRDAESDFQSFLDSIRVGPGVLGD